MSLSLISSEVGSDLGPRLKRRDLKACTDFVVQFLAETDTDFLEG